MNFGLPMGPAKTIATSLLVKELPPSAREGTCPSCFARLDWIRHGISIRGTWEEICLGKMELLTRADSFSCDPDYQTSQYSG